jgi:hypothetical protein
MHSEGCNEAVLFDIFHNDTREPVQTKVLREWGNCKCIYPQNLIEQLAGVYICCAGVGTLEDAMWKSKEHFKVHA